MKLHITRVPNLRIYVGLVFLLINGMLAGCAISDDVHAESEAGEVTVTEQTKETNILSEIVSHNFKISRTRLLYADVNEKVRANNAFCSEVLTDLESNKSVKVIEPLFVVQDYNDPVFDTYKNMCPNLDFNEYISPPSRGYPVNSPNWTGSDEQKRKLGTEYYGTKNFKLFHVDLNNNGRLEDDEYIFYADSYFSEEVLTRSRKQHPEKFQPERWGYGTYGDSDLGNFTLLNMKRCEQIYSRGMHSPNYSFDNKEKDNLTALIKYKGDYFYVDLFEIGDAVYRNYYMNLWRLFSNSIGKVENTCAYEEK